MPITYGLGKTKELCFFLTFCKKTSSPLRLLETVGLLETSEHLFPIVQCGVLKIPSVIFIYIHKTSKSSGQAKKHGQKC